MQVEAKHTVGPEYVPPPNHSQHFHDISDKVSSPHCPYKVCVAVPALVVELAVLVLDELATVFVLLVNEVEDTLLLVLVDDAPFELVELVTIVLFVVLVPTTVLVAELPPPTFKIAALNGPNQSFANTTFPASFGCTPSAVSTVVLYPDHASTTLTGLTPVLIPAAQPGIALFRSITPW